MIMTSSPRVHPHSYSVPHTPLAGSPNASPSLHPLASNMAKSPPGSGSMTPIALSSSVPKNQTRSFVRAPQVRPYQSALTARAGRPVKEVVGDTRHFADIVVGMVEQRRDAKLGKSISEGRRGRGLGLGDCAAVHWESDKAELIVDIPVWSPGSFQDLSTLHALRDATLSHTHSLISYLLRTHSLSASYRLLTRSASSSTPHPSSSGGWGCIRLAPSVSSPVSPKREHVRRTSFVGEPFKRVQSVPLLDLDQAIVDEDSEDEEEVLSKSGTSEGDEGDEESADVLIAREVERRGSKEGMAFLMTLFGQPALILT